MCRPAPLAQWIEPRFPEPRALFDSGRDLWAVFEDRGWVDAPKALAAAAFVVAVTAVVEDGPLGGKRRQGQDDAGEQRADDDGAPLRTPATTSTALRRQSIVPSRPLVPHAGAIDVHGCPAPRTGARANGRLRLVPAQDLIVKRLKVLAATVRTLIEVRRRIWTVQAVGYSNAHGLLTIETDARLHLDALKAEASEQFDLVTARNARSLKEKTHQPTPQVLPEHPLTIEFATSLELHTLRGDVASHG